MTATNGQSPITPANLPSESMSSPDTASSDVIDVRFILRVLVRWSWLIILVTAAAATNGAWNMHQFTPQYTAVLTVKAVEGGNQNNLAGSANASNLLGALGGIQLGVSRSASEFDRLMHRASSLALARVLDEKYNMMELVFGPAVEDNRSTADESISWRQRLRNYLRYNPPSKPNLEDLARFLKGKFRAKESSDSPFKSISFSHTDPEKALWFLTTIFDEAVQFLRVEFKDALNDRRSFLDTRLAETELVELRRELLGLMTTEIRKEMLSHGDLPVGAQIVDEAFVSKYRTEPNALSYIGFPSAVAFAVTTALILLIALYRSE